jgi:S-adenosylmethionine decarboxylase
MILIAKSLVKSVNAQILSVIENDDIQAFLLSESSLLVSKRRVIIKTCGTTKCLQSLELIIAAAKKFCNLNLVQDIFYSRRNFREPERQTRMHATFENEVKHLDSIIEDGAPYCLGQMNRDCWFLYTKQKTIDHEETADQTFEVLMSDLDSEAMKVFYSANCMTGAEATEKSRIDQLIPGAQIDAYQFEPCGYSANAIMTGDYYWNIHVTPEKDFSYASFETNYPKENYEELLKQVIEIFKPGHINVTVMANKRSTCDMTNMNKGFQLKNFVQKDLQIATFPRYSLHYSSYNK